MIVGLDERKKKKRGGKKKTKSLRNVATSCLLTVVSGYLDHFIRQNCRRKRRALLRPRKLYRGSEVADERGRELS